MRQLFQMRRYLHILLK